MQISDILTDIDNGSFALPEFQRDFVWSRDKVRRLFDSLYRGHPVGSLLVWVTPTGYVETKGTVDQPPGLVNVLLDGQQRVTAIYSIARGEVPPFFFGNEQTFKDLRFHLENEQFSFYQPILMRDDSLWISVTELMQEGNAGIGRIIKDQDLTNDQIGHLNQVLAILSVDLHIEQVKGADKTIDVVVDIFDRVNSEGTKLSQGDLALAKICAGWPDARNEMQKRLDVWEDNGFNFNLDWLLRSMNTVLTGEARYRFLHNKGRTEIEGSLQRATKHIDNILNMVSSRLGLDHDRVLFGRYAFPVMVRYLDQSGPLTNEEQDKLLFWFVHAGMRGRFSGSTESLIDQDLAAIDGDAPLDALLGRLRSEYRHLVVEADDFDEWSLGARFYPVLYMLSRVGRARDLGTGVLLRDGLLGKMNQLEVHHLFPKSQLYERGYSRSEVNAVANFCFLTKDTNLQISNQLPAKYFQKVELRQPGALASQWIPTDPELWKIGNYPDFLEERRKLLATAATRRLKYLLHGETDWLNKAWQVGE